MALPITATFPFPQILSRLSRSLPEEAEYQYRYGTVSFPYFSDRQVSMIKRGYCNNLLAREMSLLPTWRRSFVLVGLLLFSAVAAYVGFVAAYTAAPSPFAGAVTWTNSIFVTLALFAFFIFCYYLYLAWNGKVVTWRREAWEENYLIVCKNEIAGWYCARVPEEVEKLARAIRKVHPDARFYVEHDHRDDPFFVVKIGSNMYYARHWHSAG